MRFCGIEGCKRKHYAKNMCRNHYAKANRYKYAERINAYEEKNKEKRKAQKQKWYQENRTEERERQRKKRAENPELFSAYQRKWYLKNQDENIAIAAARNKERKQFTPVWADTKELRQFYLNCPEGHHVDHIIPLKGREISGLHVIENLQYLPAIENLAKNNHVDIQLLNEQERIKRGQK